jgi:O-acetyl-ADP-ribose deacetylase (regulator of RNase III)
MLTIKEGDLLDATESIIGHQCNTKGSMGKGVALALVNKYPEIKDPYVKVCKTYGSLLLGSTQFTPVHDGKIIANIFGQNEYGGKKINTKYDALRAGLFLVCDKAKTEGLSVALPYGIGCGLAGGDWGIVLPMIEKAAETCNITLYKLKE